MPLLFNELSSFARTSPVCILSFFFIHANLPNDLNLPTKLYNTTPWLNRRKPDTHTLYLAHQNELEFHLAYL